MIEFFIVMTKFDLDIIKEKIQYYYFLRSHIPEAFTISKTSSRNMKETLNFTQIVPVPRLVNNSDSVLVVRVKNIPVPREFDLNAWLAALVNINEVLMQESLSLNTHVVYDHKHLSLDHILSASSALRNSSNSEKLESIYADNLKYVHIVNCPPIFQILLTSFNTVLSRKLYSKFKFHDSIESLHSYIPKGVLPADYGGTERSLDELEEIWLEKLEEYKDRFFKLDSLRMGNSFPHCASNTKPNLIHAFTKLLF